MKESIYNADERRCTPIARGGGGASLTRMGLIE
jgi:hypothetical protein